MAELRLSERDREDQMERLEQLSALATEGSWGEAGVAACGATLAVLRAEEDAPLDLPALFKPLNAAFELSDDPKVLDLAVDGVLKLLNYVFALDSEDIGFLDATIPTMCSKVRLSLTLSKSDFPDKLYQALSTASVVMAGRMSTATLVAMTDAFFLAHIKSSSESNCQLVASSLHDLSNSLLDKMGSEAPPGASPEEAAALIAEIEKSLAGFREPCGSLAEMGPPPSVLALKHGLGPAGSGFFTFMYTASKLCVVDMPISSGAGDELVRLEVPERRRQRLLALDILREAVQKHAAVLKTSPLLVHAVRRCICTALLHNCCRVSPVVLERSMELLLALVTHFRAELKSELGILFDKVVLSGLLESDYCSVLQRGTVLSHFFVPAAEDNQRLMDMFVNYDIPMEHNAEPLFVFDRLIKWLANTTRGVQSAVSETAWGSDEQRVELKALCLKCFVLLVSSLAEWYRGQHKLTRSSSGSFPMSPKVAAADGDEPSEAADVEEGAEGEGDDHHTAAFDAQKRAQRVWAKAKVTFNTEHMRHAIKYLQENKVVGESAQEVADFLHTERVKTNFEKDAIGDYLAEGKPYTNEVLKCYTKFYNFAGMSIDAAMRMFLFDFRLPGEAQKIDRMLDTFAQHFCELNPDRDLFANSDAAFVLCYSIIMLNTDLHNPQVPQKMSEEEFIRNNRGINDGGDINPDYMRTMYADIRDNEIKLKDDDESYDAKFTAGALVRKTKGALYVEEMERTIQQTYDALGASATSQAQFYPAENAQVARPLFETMWTSLLGIFTHHLDLHSEKVNVGTVSKCLEGLQSCLELTLALGKTEERMAFLNILGKYTFVAGVSLTEELQLKKTKLGNSTALATGAHLEQPWLKPFLGDSAEEVTAEATEAVTAIARLAIQHAKHSENKQRLQSIEETFEGIKPGDIVKENRVLLRHGPLVKSCRGGKSFKRYEFFLFTDALIYAAGTSNGSGSRYTLHRLYDLNDVDVAEAEDGNSNGFKINNPDKSIIVYASSPDEKQEWMDEIRRTGAQASADRATDLVAKKTELEALANPSSRAEKKRQAELKKFISEAEASKGDAK